MDTYIKDGEHRRIALLAILASRQGRAEAHAPEDSCDCPEHAQHYRGMRIRRMTH